MAVREIVQLGDPVLRERAKPVESFGPELRALVADMIETMRVANGVGLAGPQVAERLRVLVFEIPESDEHEDEPLAGRPYALVNPEILEVSKATEEGQEGCLSIPGYIGEVQRHAAITVQARNEWGKPKKIKAEGFLARVLQHEIDHLDGILYIDRLESEDKLYRIEQVEEAEEEATVVA
ncbi:MAG TPA: peptide deformylase [Ardenticatenaceae bacterium]|nr:peptide deformylase [Ardenticatenaceae bacterium]